MNNATSRGGTFADRVRTLRETWLERRNLRGLASNNDFASRLQVLTTLHRWAAECVETVQEIYADEFEIEISPAPSPGALAPGFTVLIDRQAAFSIVLSERVQHGEARWQLVASAAGTPAGPARNTGQWTRTRLEDLLLAALARHERARFEGHSLRWVPA